MLGCIKKGMAIMVLYGSLLGCQSTPEREHTVKRSPLSAAQMATDEQYASLIADIKAGPDPARLKTLREHYVNTSYYQPYNMAEFTLGASMFAAISAKDWAGCLAQSATLLANNYISLNGHYGAMVCQLERGEQQQGEYHQEVLDSLVSAIWLSGDGKTAETAFFITSTAELYTFVQMHGLEVTQQALAWHNETPYDVMTILNPRDNTEFTWYFDISAQMNKGFANDK